MSDAVLTRLRALLGSAGVEREADGLPRATPDSSESFAHVCHVASEEGWRIRLEGQGTWLPADAPAFFQSSGNTPRPIACGATRPA